MSYSASTSNISKDDIKTISVSPQTAPVGNRSQLHIDLIKAVLPVLATVVGRPEDEISVSISGHANIDGSPVEGWADEFLTVTIHQRRKSEVQ